MLTHRRKRFRFIATACLWACLVLVFSTAQLPAAFSANRNFYGMHIGNDTDVAKAIPVLKDLGVQWTRLWVDTDWSPQEHPAFQKAKTLKAAGFNTIVEFNQAKVPTPEQVKAYFDWAQTVPGLPEAIDVWEVLNELNIPRYWRGDAQEYVNNVLKPAWNSLHPRGEKVLGGAFTAWQNSDWGTGITERYVKAGYLNYVDYAGTHPYTNTVKQLREYMKAIAKVYGSKPMIISEWNFKAQKNPKAWAKLLDQARPILQDRVFTACYYRFIGFNKEGGWPGIVRKTKQGNYTPKQPFYDLYKRWPKSRSVASTAAPQQKKAPPTSSKGLGQYSPATAPVLRVGSWGQAVADVQAALKQAGLYGGSIDASFGPQTQTAVIRLQASRSLRQDGIVGPQTWAVLLSL